MSSFTPASNTLWLPNRNACVGEALQRLFYLDCQLARVIDVHAHPERMILRQHRAQLRRDPLREENRHPRTDAQKFDVPDSAQPRQQLLEPVIAENQSVAPAQKHVAYLGVRFKIAERLLEIRAQFLFANSANHPTPCAVAAVTRAPVCH